MSSAKSRSSRVERVHLRPRGRSDVIYRIAQSIVSLKSYADIEHSCLTPVFTAKLGSLFTTLHSALDDKDDLLRNSMSFEQAV